MNYFCKKKDEVLSPKLSSKLYCIDGIESKNKHLKLNLSVLNE